MPRVQNHFKKHHKQSWCWKVAHRAALDFLELVRPYMRVKAKTARIDLLLSEYDKVTPKNGKYTADMLSAKLSFEKRFLALT